MKGGGGAILLPSYMTQRYLLQKSSNCVYPYSESLAQDSDFVPYEPKKAAPVEAPVEAPVVETPEVEVKKAPVKRKAK